MTKKPAKFLHNLKYAYKKIAEGTLFRRAFCYTGLLLCYGTYVSLPPFSKQLF